ncbi:GNAT family N-acetyltransferase [Allosphingosinicella sp.]|uniref:GNAT family N-acetyltransferase n=1 Tax=Allosphingosinicella sp. TaxID=2823234 RepID=UPI002FC18271
MPSRTETPAFAGVTGGDGGIPVLTTERLLLRAPSADDLDASAAMWSNPEVVRHIGGKPFTREEVWSRILRARGLWSMLGYGYWAVYDRDSDRFVGDVGFADFHRDFTPSIEGIPEMGWVLDPWCHGRGYASEAVKAAIRWGEAELSAPEFSCIIDPDNRASIKVAEKAGFIQSAETTYKGGPTLVFRRSR